MSVQGMDVGRSVPQVPMGDLVGRVARRLVVEVERTLEPAGLTIEQWRVLDLLADGVGHPMAEIADHAMVPAPTCTKIVDRLADSALVYRRTDQADRRRVLVLLSEHGRDVHEEHAARVVAAEDAASGALEPSERAQLRALLERLR